jgi:hypothetical protein
MEQSQNLAVIDLERFLVFVRKKSNKTAINVKSI